MKMFLVAGATCIIMASATAAFAGGPLSMWFYGSATEASDKLSLSCADRNAVVVEQDDRHVLCQREAGGLTARYLFSGRSGTTPMLNIRFALLRDGQDTRIQASQWIEVQNGAGQVQRSPLDSAKYDAAMREVLHGIGAHDLPSSENAP